MLLSVCKSLCFLGQMFCCLYFFNIFFPFLERIFSGVFFFCSGDKTFEREGSGLGHLSLKPSISP